MPWTALPLLALLFSLAAASTDEAQVVELLTDADDECAGQETCAVHALQRRALSLQAAPDVPNETTVSPHPVQTPVPTVVAQSVPASTKAPEQTAAPDAANETTPLPTVVAQNVPASTKAPEQTAPETEPVLPNGTTAAPDIPVNTSEEAGGSCETYGCNVMFQKGQSCACHSWCEEQQNCCADYKALCPAMPEGQMVKGYHQTDPYTAGLILNSEFRPGHIGYCGGGVYFATSPASTFTKAISPDSKHGAMIEVGIDLGRTQYVMDPSCFSTYWSHHFAGALSTRPTAEYLAERGLDSVTFNPSDGLEYVLGDHKQIRYMKSIPPPPGWPSWYPPPPPAFNPLLPWPWR